MALMTDTQFDWLMSAAEVVQRPLGEIVSSEPDEVFAVLVAGSVRLLLLDGQRRESTLCNYKSAGSFWSSAMLTASEQLKPLFRASDDCVYLRINKTLMREIDSKCPQLLAAVDRESSILSWYSMLKRTSRFRELDFQLLKPFLSQAAHTPFKSGEVFAQTGAADEIFILLSGAIKTEQNGSSLTLQQGDWFTHGRMTPFQSAAFKNIQAVEPGELLRISENTYKEIREVQPELTSGFDSALLRETHGLAKFEEKEDLIARVDEHSVVEPAHQVIEDEGLLPKLRRSLRKYPIVYQRSELECGITCLHMICLFFGKAVSLSQLREMCEIGRGGTSMGELSDAAEQLGFFSRGVHTTYAGLMKLKPPLICFWKQNHFVVLYEINASNAVVGDPGTGLERIERDVFTRDFSNSALELVPSVEFGKNIETRPFFGTFKPIIAPHKLLVRDIVVTSLVYQLLMIVTPVFTQVVLDQVIVHQDLNMLTMLLIGMVIVTLFQAAMGFIREFTLEFLALKADLTLFSELFKRLLSLPFTFFDKHSTGDLLTRFGESASVVQFFAGNGALAVLDLFMAIVFLVFIYFYNFTFGLVTTVYVLCLGAMVACYMPTLKGLSRKAYDKQIAAESFLVEAIRGIERVKSAAAERRTRWKWELLFVDRLNVRFQELVAKSTVSALVKVIQVAGQVVILWLGAHMVIEKSLTIGQLMAVNMLVSMIANPFIRVAELSYAFQNVSVALEGLSDVLLESPEELNPANKIHISEVKGHVRFDNVTYRYSGRESANALTNVSFEAKPGQMIGIVGRTGSGKTTLLRLIQGLYLPTEGRIYIDGHDLSKTALTGYRQSIGVVSQHDYYFRGTIRENIAFYKPDASMAEIVRACTISGANEFISDLPSGYESVLSEGASNFSGGQRQCMAVARAILHDPPILIFDEATSGMDSETESRIQHCMENMRSRCTMFVVAHRLSTVRMADQLLVIDKGKIVESGKHDCLIKEKGLYYYLCQQQSLV